MDHPPQEEGEGTPRHPCGAVCGGAQCMCLICLGGTPDASTVVASQEAHGDGDDAMADEEDL